MCTQAGIDLVLLLGHWDKPNMGAANGTDVPGMYEHVRSMEGCDGCATRHDASTRRDAIGHLIVFFGYF